VQAPHSPPATIITIITGITTTIAPSALGGCHIADGSLLRGAVSLLVLYDLRPLLLRRVPCYIHAMKKIAFAALLCVLAAAVPAFASHPVGKHVSRHANKSGIKGEPKHVTRHVHKHK